MVVCEQNDLWAGRETAAKVFGPDGPIPSQIPIELYSPAHRGTARSASTAASSGQPVAAGTPTLSPGRCSASILFRLPPSVPPWPRAQPDPSESGLDTSPVFLSAV